MPKLFATCARGLESVLTDELQAIGATEVIPGRGGVQFRGRSSRFVQSEFMAAHRDPRALAHSRSDRHLA